jgi:hypothetical protein
MFVCHSAFIPYKNFAFFQHCGQGQLFFYVAHCIWIVLNIQLAANNSMLNASIQVAAISNDSTINAMPLFDCISARISETRNVLPVPSGLTVCYYIRGRKCLI